MPGEPLVRIEVNEAQRLELEQTLINVRDGVPRAISGAINKTIRKARTRLVRAAKGVLPLAASEIQERIGQPRLASPQKLSGSVTATRKGVPAYKFPHQQVRYGVTVQMRLGGGYELLESTGDRYGTFLATMPNGKEGIFQHSSKSSPRRVYKLKDGKIVGNSQLPIQQKYGLTVVGALLSGGLLKGEQEWADEEFARQLDSQMDRFTKSGPLAPVET